MALISVKEIGNLATSSTTAAERAGTRYFLALFDAPAGVLDAENASGIPLVRDPWGSDYPYMLVKQRQGKILDQESNRREWLVQVDYSDQVTNDANPLNLPPEISWDFSEATENYFIDKSTPPKACVNSAGDHFANLLVRETGQVSCTYSVNKATYSPATAISYRDVVNSDAFTIDGANILVGQAKLSGIPAAAWVTANIVMSGVPTSVRYRKVTYHLKFKASWLDVVQDRGNHEIPASNPGQPRRIVSSAEPSTVVQQWPLDGSGKAKPNFTDTPATISLQPYATLPFAPFGFA